MNFLTRPITSERLEQKGQSLYKVGKILTFCGICALVLLVVLALIVISGYGAEGLAFTFALVGFGGSGIEVFGSFVALLSYVGILLGIVGSVMYFQGLHIFALGRIAHNTEKENK